MRLRATLNKLLARGGYQLTKTYRSALQLQHTIGNLEEGLLSAGSSSQPRVAGLRKSAMVFLVAGQDILPMLENCLLTLSRVNVSMPKKIYHLPCSDSAKITSISARYGLDLVGLPSGTENRYSEFGTASFNRITNLKWSVILKTLEEGFDTVIYSDSDISFISNFESYIAKASRDFPWGFQSEALSQYPPVLCTGFMFFTREARPVLVELTKLSQEAGLDRNDQELLNHLLDVFPNLRSSLYVLPEMLFQNGLFDGFSLGSRNVNSSPFLFHANFCKGIEAKIAMLRRMKLWILD